MCPHQGAANSVNARRERDAEWHVNICHPPHGVFAGIYVDRIVLVDRCGIVEFFRGVNFLEPGDDEVILRFESLERAKALSKSFAQRLWIMEFSREQVIAPFLRGLHTHH
jgi:hypothetical protein